MSKDTPEVGDIWEHRETKNKHRVIDIDNCKIIYTVCLGYKNHILDNPYSYDWFPQGFEYLGKSKANIEQLFEVEDNGRCIEDNTPHAESTVLFKDLENKEC